jgi:hypothetical protein
MRFVLFALVLASFVACEKKLTPEEIEQKKEEERAHATPTPKVGLTKDRLKDYKNPLEKK